MFELVAWLYVAIVAGVVVFQFCLIAGASWGHLTQGGRYEGPLPPPGRIAAGVSVPVLVFMALSVMSAAGLSPHWAAWTGWATLGVQALSTLLNWITPSRPERMLWGPVTSVMLAMVVIVLLAG